MKIAMSRLLPPGSADIDEDKDLYGTGKMEEGSVVRGARIQDWGREKYGILTRFWCSPLSPTCYFLRVSSIVGVYKKDSGDFWVRKKCMETSH